MGLAALVFVAIAAVGALSLGLVVGYLTSLSGKRWHAFTTHPWRVFWRVGIPLYLLGTFILVGALAPFRNSESGSRVATLLVGFSMIPLVASMVVLALAAIQGLRVTWLRSPWKVILICLPWWALNLLQVSGEFTVAGPSHGFNTLWAMIALNTILPLASWIAHKVSFRIAAGRAV